MIRFWSKKAAPPVPPELRKLTDDALAQLIRRNFEEQNDVVGALFLVAYENFFVYFNVFLNAAKTSKDFPASLEGMATFLDASLRKHSGSSVSDQVNSRRFFYLYLAALLQIVHGRAKAKPELWDVIATIWVALLPGARALRRVIDSTGLWTPDEVVYFRDIRTEQEGEDYCLAHMAPSEIRYHKVVREWQEKDLSPEVKAELRALDRMFRDEESGDMNAR